MNHQIQRSENDVYDRMYNRAWRGGLYSIIAAGLGVAGMVFLPKDSNPLSVPSVLNALSGLTAVIGTIEAAYFNGRNDTLRELKRDVFTARYESETNSLKK